MATKAWIEANRDRCRGYKKKFYEANRSKVKAESVAYRNETKAMLASIKAKSGCSICKENDPVCLDFHHKDPGDKELSIAAAITRGLSRKAILIEISKCDVVCSNCHRKLHALGQAGMV